MTTHRGGRPKKPTNLHILHGTHQPCRHGQRDANAPYPPAQPDSEPPEWLDAYGQEFYRDVLRMTSGAGITTTADLFALAMLASAWSHFRHLREFVDEHGTGFNVWQRTNTGAVAADPKDRPILKMRRSFPETTQVAAIWRDVLVGLREFGLTPSARAGISAHGPKAVDQSADQWLDV